MKAFTRIGTLLVAHCMALCLLPLSAKADTYDVLTYKITDGEVTITDCAANTTGKVVVPDMIEGCPVTAIGEEAFAYQYNITEIVLPDTVKTIGKSAFSHCNYLTAVNIPSGVTAIENYTFYNCYNLASLNIPAAVTSIHQSAFFSNGKLASLTVEAGNPVYHSAGNCVIKTADKVLVLGTVHSEIPSDGSVTTIESYAFAQQLDMETIIIPNGVTTLKESAFNACMNVRTINLSETVTDVHPAFVSGASNLQTLTVAASNPVYHSSNNCLIETATKILIKGCKSSVIPTDESVTIIGEKAFAGCSFTSISIPEGITTIGDNAFASSQITSILIPEGVTTIDDAAFQNCNKLTSVQFPSTLKNIGRYAFYETRLEQLELPNGLLTVGEYAFGRISATEVTFPRSVTNIGRDCFNYCTNLQKVTILNPDTNIYNLGSHYQLSSYTSTMPTIYGYSATYAEQCANSWGHPFVSLGAAHYCTFDQMNTDAAYRASTASCTAAATYYYSCTCGEKGTQTFSYGTATDHSYDNACDADCNICGAGRTVEHKPEEWLFKEEVHWQKCMLCGTTVNRGSHDFDNECDDFCETCGYTRVTNHSYANEWRKDSSGHWNECRICSHKINVQTHQFKNTCDTSCDTCGYIRTITHNYQTKWSSNDDTHWHQCSVCGEKTDEAAHIPGAAPTETSSQTCTACGYVLQPPLGHTHNYSTDWSKDEISHWHVCACGAKAEEAAHSWDAGTETKKPEVGQTGTMTYTCTICGTQYAADIPALEPEPEPSEPVPSEPVPSAPEPSEPAPTEPAPTESSPTVPPATAPAPTEEQKFNFVEQVLKPYRWLGVACLVLVAALLLILRPWKKKPKQQ